MKQVFVLLTCSLLAASPSVGQEATSEQKTADKSGIWMSRLVGKWNTTSQPVSKSELAQPPYTGTMEARMMGAHWLIAEYDADMGGTKFKAMQRLRFDAEKEKYAGPWVDSFFDHEWDLDGTSNGTRLTINSSGPDPTNPGTTANFRDIYEFKAENLIATTSELQDEEGNWQAFMKGEMRRTEDNQSKKEEAITKSQTEIMPFLMFVGKAEEAIQFYISLFPNAKVTMMEKYGAGETGPEGTIKQARFTLAGQQVMCIDSPPVHDFTFTPSFSFFVECESSEQLKSLFTKLSEGGKVMMPLNNYGFSKQFGWTSDRFGVSWQLNLAE